MHKQPIFQLVLPIQGKPVILDDTCYFLPFDDPTEAVLVTTLLKSKQCTYFIESLVFWDSKRPITKKLLSRIDLNKLPVDTEETITKTEIFAAEMNMPFVLEKARQLIGHLRKPEIADALLF